MTDQHMGAPDTGSIPHPHAAAECPKCFVELQEDGNWWRARPANSRLVGLVVARDNMASVVEQRDDLARFGVPIEGFRHPAPEILESWEDRLGRFFATLGSGDVLVISSLHALGRDAQEERRTLAALRTRGIVVKVLEHGARHLEPAAR